MMKLLPILLIALVQILSAQSPPREYPMAQIPKDDPRFAAVLSAIRKAHASDAMMTQMDANSETGRFIARSQAMAQESGSAPNPEKLIVNLKSGATYQIFQGTQSLPCRTCSGAGRIHDLKATTPDKKSPCNACQGKAKTETPVEVVIRW